MSIELKSKYRGGYTACPHCKGTDIREVETERKGQFFHFTRTWFCRTCWWDAAVQLRDDEMEAQRSARA